MSKRNEKKQAVVEAMDAVEKAGKKVRAIGVSVSDGKAVDLTTADLPEAISALVCAAELPIIEAIDDIVRIGGLVMPARKARRTLKALRSELVSRMDALLKEAVAEIAGTEVQLADADAFKHRREVKRLLSGVESLLSSLRPPKGERKAARERRKAERSIEAEVAEVLDEE